jgi:hypothetical protein
MIIDVIRPSASRPDLLKTTHEEFLKRAIWNGGFRFVLHEDVIEAKKSQRCIEFGLEQCYTVQISNPPVGQGESVHSLWKESKTDYIFHLEDDWLFIRDFDLNKAVSLMNNHPEVNQICYHKRPIMAEKGEFKKEQIDFDGQPLVLAPHFGLLPGLWRRSFFNDRWKTFPLSSNFGGEINMHLKGIGPSGEFRDHEWMKLHIGAYFWGKHGEDPFVQHLGIQSRRMGQ